MKEIKNKRKLTRGMESDYLKRRESMAYNMREYIPYVIIKDFSHDLLAINNINSFFSLALKSLCIFHKNLLRNKFCGTKCVFRKIETLPKNNLLYNYKK